MKNPHNWCSAIDPPRRHPPRRWRCRYCDAVGTLNELEAVDCTYEYPPCRSCGMTPTCAPDCPGIAAVLGSLGSKAH